MKRRGLLRQLEAHGCEMMREGGNHTVYLNRARKEIPQFRATGKSMNFWRERFVRI